MLKKAVNYFTAWEKTLWACSVLFITAAFLIFDGESYPSMIVSLIGVTSLIFLSKGNPIGQVLIIIFAVFYGIISLSFAYYGEMITYVGMSVPMAILALITWLRNPYKGNKSEVRVARLTLKKVAVGLALTVIVTIAFYFILDALGTSNLLVSTMSVATSFFAVYLTFMRSSYYALAYALNDVVLIVMWVLATLEDISYVSMAVCFIVFLVNDMNGFISWRRMEKRQRRE